MADSVYIDALKNLTHEQSAQFIRSLIHALTVISRTTFYHDNKHYLDPEGAYSINEMIHRLIRQPWEREFSPEYIVDMLIHPTNGLDPALTHYAFNKALNSVTTQANTPPNE